MTLIHSEPNTKLHSGVQVKEGSWQSESLVLTLKRPLGSHKKTKRKENSSLKNLIAHSGEKIRIIL